MKNAAVVCEFDPLHKGHEYLIRKTRESGAERIVCILSGAICQRGEPAFFSKHERARAAILAGADIVVELPYPYSGASAEHFAFGAVSIARRIGGVDTLAFGCECADKNLLLTCAERLLSPEFDDEYKKKVKTSPQLSAAAAMESAYASLYGDGSLLRGANNVLAIEYIKAAKRANAGLDLFPVSRIGADHGETGEREGFCSASYIRERARSGDGIGELVADGCACVFENELEAGRVSLGFDALGEALLLHFRMLDDDTEETAETAGGLRQRMIRAARSCAEPKEFFESLKTKRFTEARLRRAMLFSLCGVTQEDLRTEPSYTTLLAANESGVALLSEYKKSREITVVSNPSALGRLQEKHHRQKLLCSRAEGVRALALKNKASPDRVLATPPFILKEKK